MKIDLLIAALIEQEGASDDSDHWDVNSRAVGCLQIHQSILSDLENFSKKKYSMEDLKNHETSISVCKQWLGIWGSKYKLKNGQEAGYEQLARMWNGGPKGYLKDSTLKYWKSVKDKLEKMGEIFN